MRTYKHLSSEERNTLHRGINDGLSLRQISRDLGRSVSTLSRELKRNAMTKGNYDATQAVTGAQRRRRRGLLKLKDGSILRKHVFEHIQKGWSPQQIAGQLKEQKDAQLPAVSHETIYRAIYILPRGELRKDLIGCLRQGRSKRGLKGKRGEKASVLKNIVTIDERDPQVLERARYGDWEGDLIKGARNASAIGTLVDRKSRYVIIVKLKNSTAAAALEAFSSALKRLPRELRQTFTYDRGTEMALHQQLTEQTDIKVYFCNPHSPWQRPTNENTNGLIRQYLPKGTDLTPVSQEDLDKIAMSLNTRPRQCLKFSSPLAVFSSALALYPNVALDL